MLRGLRKALGKSRRAGKRHGDRSVHGDASTTRSGAGDSSVAPSSVLFPLDLADAADATSSVCWDGLTLEQGALQPVQQAALHQQLPAATAASHHQEQGGESQMLLTQQGVHSRQQWPGHQGDVGDTSGQAPNAQAAGSPSSRGGVDASAARRRAAAQQRRLHNPAALVPGSCLYQIRSLLSLSTLFEHTLQRDAAAALSSVPADLLAAAAAAAAQQQQQQQQALLPGGWQLPPLAAASSICSYCAGASPPLDSGGSCVCTCGGGGCAAALRQPSGSAAATAHVALALAGWGYRVIVRRVLHSKAYWTRAMDNTFIVALDSSGGGHVEYVVDPHFRDAFALRLASDSYRCVCVCVLVLVCVYVCVCSFVCVCVWHHSPPWSGTSLPSLPRAVLFHIPHPPHDPPPLSTQTSTPSPCSALLLPSSSPPPTTVLCGSHCLQCLSACPASWPLWFSCCVRRWSWRSWSLGALCLPGGSGAPQ